MSNIFEANVRGYRFTFQPFNAGSVMGYHVETKDKDGARYEFRMEKEEEADWVMEGENLPDWIAEMEHEIKNAVEENS